MTCRWCQGLILLVALHALPGAVEGQTGKDDREEALESQSFDGLACTLFLEIAKRQRFRW